MGLRVPTNARERCACAGGVSRGSKGSARLGTLLARPLHVLAADVHLLDGTARCAHRCADPGRRGDERTPGGGEVPECTPTDASVVAWRHLALHVWRGLCPTDVAVVLCVPAENPAVSGQGDETGGGRMQGTRCYHGAGDVRTTPKSRGIGPIGGTNPSRSCSAASGRALA